MPMWALYFNGDLVLASTNHDELIDYLDSYQPGTYQAEIDHVSDPRLIEAIAPTQARNIHQLDAADTMP